jgi:hypothetical protein
MVLEKVQVPKGSEFIRFEIKKAQPNGCA